MSSDILALSLDELAHAIRSGKIGSVEATRAVIAALDGRGRALNATALLWPERALELAAACDAERAKGRLRGALHGVPMAHKDMFYREGQVAGQGSRIRGTYVASRTAAVLQRLDLVGAIDVGRLNMVEFALGVTGHNNHTDTPKNAHDLERITGGSTSGGSTAVAAGLIPATLGSDTGGSIRIPASFCGLVGLKPTYGLVSRAGAMPLSFSLDHIGPLARTTRDVATMLQAIAGHDPDDTTTSRRPVPAYHAGLERGVRGLRLFHATGGLGCTVDPVIDLAVRDAIARLGQEGATIAEGSLDKVEAINAIRRLVLMAECGSVHRDHVAERRSDFVPQTLARMEPGFALSAVDYLLAQRSRGPALDAFCAAIFSKADLVVLPTCPVQTPRIVDTDTGGDARFVETANAIGQLIGVFNWLGLPAISVPVGLDSNNMPIGLQIVGRPFAEALVLQAAAAVERSHGPYRPKVFAMAEA
ncbi:MAG TPA: amidase [Geminicoccus sp.]|jgi:aspartyl-tRNA(Asn)/glutamyl-tRNA(Gln) amidotransferase subunit A|uniref:amidase n=1 Tax=Geminicoccus sp. TaxID=2024832 RepID=UPI002E36276F|nr:amidase [Geminicoccus sp.]HEX2527714.1 amidase [Geminicoccus sp.]